MKLLKTLSLVTTLTLLHGCATTSGTSGNNTKAKSSSLASTSSAEIGAGYDPEIQAIFKDLQSEGEWNAVLNFDRLGQAAFAKGDLVLAGKAFDAAIERIDAVYADNPAAKKARSVWTSEGTKDFKGEPYERAMTFFYRGLIDLAEGDYENARAAFKSADFQSTLSQTEVYDNAFVVATWMAGWASQCNQQQETANDYYASALNSTLARTSFIKDDYRSWFTPEHNNGQPGNTTAVVYLRGSGPSKFGEGKHAELLKFKPGTFDQGVVFAAHQSGKDFPFKDYRSMTADERLAHMASVWTGGSSYEGLSYHALTRGGRQVDGILEGKARFKDGAESAAKAGGAVADAGVQIALQGALSGNSDMQEFGSAAGALGLLFQLGSSVAASSTKPAADTRSWSALPELVYAGDQSLKVDEPVVISRHQLDTGVAETVAPMLDRVAGSCRLLVVSDGVAVDGAESARRGSLQTKEQAKVMKANRKRDAAFRTYLAAEFSKPADTSVASDPVATAENNP